ncbi:MAG: hypothetical protein ACRER1_05840 [Gammaproteobacteria bacterium]
MQKQTSGYSDTPLAKALGFKAEIMATNETHGTFDDILATAKPELRVVCEALRRQITSLHGDLVEVVWPNQRIASFGVGPKKMTEHYAYIGVQNSHVNLGFYHGASLPDPQGILEGTGKKLRHVKICDISSSNSPPVVALLHAAIADRKRHASKA